MSADGGSYCPGPFVTSLLIVSASKESRAVSFDIVARMGGVALDAGVDRADVSEASTAVQFTIVGGGLGGGGGWSSIMGGGGWVGGWHKWVCFW